MPPEGEVEVTVRVPKAFWVDVPKVVALTIPFTTKAVVETFVLNDPVGASISLADTTPVNTADVPEIAGVKAADLRQRFNFFRYEMLIDFSPNQAKKLDPRLGIAAALLLGIIEGKQSN